LLALYPVFQAWHRLCNKNIMQTLRSILTLFCLVWGLPLITQPAAAQVRVESVDLMAFSIPLKKAFKTSKGSSSTCYGIFVQIQAQDLQNPQRKFTSLGTILPRTLVTNETKRDAWEGALAMRRILLGRSLEGSNLQTDMTALKHWLENLDQLARERNLTYRKPPTRSRQLRATLSGFDMALLDLLGKMYDKPICDLFIDHATRDTITRSAPTFNATDTAADLEDDAQELHVDYQAIRVKIGLDFERDVRRIAAVAREIAQSDQPQRDIWVDVNQAWKDAPTSLAQLALIADSLEKTGYTGTFICEQPTREDDMQALADVTHAVRQWPSQSRTPIRIMADESVWILEDLQAMHKRDAADMVNIKVQKAGGIFHSMEMGRYLQEHAPQIGVYVGGLVMTDIGAWANVQLCFALPRMDYQTSGAPRRNFPINPALTPLNYSTGRQIARPTTAGLGTALDLNAIKPYITQTN
jgi:L-alanine-DL-glutamate epimerase-like enolase superfamily enzyme